jgi:predicted transcriptional regulator
MTTQIGNLHKVLKDQTRRNIILLLNSKTALTYTELMEEMGFTTTGLLNYHLKALGDLVAKNEAGQYVLSEKGKVASRLLMEFSEPTPKQVS